MALSRFILPFADVGSGIKPSDGAQLFFYETGTSTFKDTFTDASGTIPNANPVIANSSGVFGDIFTAGTYKVVLKDKNGSQRWEADPVTSDSAGAIQFSTLQEATESSQLEVGQIANITERSTGNGGGGAWLAVLSSSVTNDGISTVQNTGSSNPPISLVFQASGTPFLSQLGATESSLDDSAIAQHSINEFGGFIVDEKTFYVGNVILKDFCIIRGVSLKSTLKLVDNAYTKSVNGSLIDGNGDYPGNVIASTLNHDGAEWASETRAYIYDNDVYAAKDCIIEGLTIDGNKANNQLGESGENSSAMGAGVNLMLCSKIQVLNCNIINNRLDGVFIGYTLTGGSDDCTIKGNKCTGNQRTSIAQVTGQRNIIEGNSLGRSTTGTGVTELPSVDIEANLDNEVNRHHVVNGNALNSISVVSTDLVDQSGIVVSSNTITGRINLGSPSACSGLVISGNTIIRDTSITGQDAINRAGEQNAAGDADPTLIIGNTFIGFDYVLRAELNGQHAKLTVKSNLFKCSAFGEVTRGRDIEFSENTFRLSNVGAHSECIKLSNTLGGSITDQGNISFNRNEFIGTSPSIFCALSNDGTWDNAGIEFTFDNNTFTMDGIDSIISGQLLNIAFKRNNFNAAINGVLFIATSGSAEDTVITGNSITGSGFDMFNDIPSLVSNLDVSGNTLNNININLVRPLKCRVERNSVYDGIIRIVYSFTSTGVGGSLLASNGIYNSVAVDNGLEVVTGSGFNIADFLNTDACYGNVIGGIYNVDRVLIDAALLTVIEGNGISLN